MTKFRTSRGLRSAIAPVTVTILLLAGLCVDQATWRVPTAEAAPYHALVRDAASRVPLHIGSWLGTDVPIPQAAVKLLKPNVIVSRRYEDLRSGDRADFLLVQCTDARDILGHYPPVCYVSHGWTMVSAEPRDWDVDGLTIPGTAYSFTMNRNGLPSRMTVYNFILLPDGQICRGMDEVDSAAQDLRQKFLGAAQIQLVFRGGASRESNDRVLQLIVRATRELIDIIRRGLPHEEK